MKGCQIALLTVIYRNPQFSSMACHLLFLHLIPNRIEFLGKLSQLQIEGDDILNLDVVNPGIIFLFSISSKTSSPAGSSDGHLGPFRVEKRRLRGRVFTDYITTCTLEDQVCLELCSRRKTGTRIQ